ncbi:Uma2 family endonuclease [Leptolyngbya sp. AN03gr2]|uniref:Uma2 family endonuclease n=1 Tax=unclassified Leptolyngbya TaxID=2650499 RepID=UPI003D31729D
MIAELRSPIVTWEKLPADYVLPNDPVDNITQPMLAMALTDSLAQAGKLSETTLTPTNYGICATIDSKIVVKAPDWSFVPQITVPRSEVERSYTPNLQGSIPVIVMEFLSHTGSEPYSIKPSYPPGKWYFYEQILQVPNYVIFEPESGEMEVYRLDEKGFYRPQLTDENGRYWIPEMQLFLGVWQGERDNRSGYWLRWWDESEQLLAWGTVAAERQRSQRLAEKLRELGVDPDQL